MAHRIHEHGHRSRGAREQTLEIVEAIVLASVAVLTAWSGYQAARWDARSTQSYALAASKNLEAQEEHTLAGHDRLYDITTFDSWVDAKVRGEAKLAEFFQRQFRPEYAVAFEAWLKTDPFDNPRAPGSPIAMTEYRNEKAERSLLFRKESARLYQEAVQQRETGDQYIRVTVGLATVLLLTALSQRFRIPGPRIGLLLVALVMLVVAMYWIVRFPRA
jgi:hypothetical protein